MAASDSHRLLEAFDLYAEKHPNSSIGEQAEIIRAANIAAGEKIAWCQTSVCSFDFDPEYKRKADYLR